LAKDRSKKDGNPGGGQEGLKVLSRIRITGVESEKKKDAQISGLELNVELTDVQENGEFLEIRFKYSVIYKEDVGFITLKGILVLQTDASEVKKQVAFYRKNNYFDSPWAESIANNINFKCATEAIFPAKIIDLPPPIMPPRIGMAPGEERQGRQGQAGGRRPPSGGVQEKPAPGRAPGPQQPRPRGTGGQLGDSIFPTTPNPFKKN